MFGMGERERKRIEGGGGSTKKFTKEDPGRRLQNKTDWGKEREFGNRGVEKKKKSGAARMTHLEGKVVSTAS